jgi:hypothetical protein
MPAVCKQLNPRQLLKQLADKLPSSEFKPAFTKHCSDEGRPAKPVLDG